MLKKENLEMYMEPFSGELYQWAPSFSSVHTYRSSILLFGNVFFSLHLNVPLSVMDFVSILFLKKVTSCLYPMDPSPSKTNLLHISCTVSPDYSS